MSWKENGWWVCDTQLLQVLWVQHCSMSSLFYGIILHLFRDYCFCTSCDTTAVCGAGCGKTWSSFAVSCRKRCPQTASSAGYFTCKVRNELGLPLLLKGTICSLTCFPKPDSGFPWPAAPHLAVPSWANVLIDVRIVQEMFWMLCPKPWYKTSIAGGRSSGWKALVLRGVQGAGAR